MQCLNEAEGGATAGTAESWSSHGAGGRGEEKGGDGKKGRLVAPHGV